MHASECPRSRIGTAVCWAKMPMPTPHCEDIAPMLCFPSRSRLPLVYLLGFLFCSGIHCAFMFSFSRTPSFYMAHNEEKERSLMTIIISLSLSLMSLSSSSSFLFLFPRAHSCLSFFVFYCHSGCHVTQCRWAFVIGIAFRASSLFHTAVF